MIGKAELESDVRLAYREKWHKDEMEKSVDDGEATVSVSSLLSVQAQVR